MALPVTITGASCITHSGFIGPVLASDGAYYVFAPTAADTPTIAAYKATDPTSSFSSVATIDFVDAMQSIAVALRDASVDVYRRSSVGLELRNSVFTLATPAFSAIGSVDAGAEAGNYGVAAATRSDGDRLIAYGGAPDSVMGTAYSRCDYARYEGTSYAAGLNLSNVPVSEQHYSNAIGVLATSDRFHCFFKNQTTSVMFLSTVLSTNNFGQTGTTTPSQATVDAAVHADPYPIGQGTYALSLVLVPYKDVSAKTSVVSFTDADAPTPSVSADVGDNAVKSNANGVALHVIVGNATEAHLLYVGTNDHLYHSVNTGSGWAADVDEKTLTGCTYISASVYARGGADVIGFVWWNGTSLVYDEIALAPPPASTSFIFPPMPSSMVSLLVR